MSDSKHEATPWPIRQFGDPVLRAQAAPVRSSEIGSAQVQNIIDVMVASLHMAKGVGLAAPQVGVLQRIVIIDIPASWRAGYGPIEATPLTVLINPELVNGSEARRRAPEACLSINTEDGGVYEGTLERAETVVVRAYDRSGHEFTLTGSSLLGRALQHELDHLDGILFTDHIKELRDLRICYPVAASDRVLSGNTHLVSESPVL